MPAAFHDQHLAPQPAAFGVDRGGAGAQLGTQGVGQLAGGAAEEKGVEGGGFGPAFSAVAGANLGPEAEGLERVPAVFGQGLVQLDSVGLGAQVLQQGEDVAAAAAHLQHAASAQGAKRFQHERHDEGLAQGGSRRQGQGMVGVGVLPEIPGEEGMTGYGPERRQHFGAGHASGLDLAADHPGPGGLESILHGAMIGIFGPHSIRPRAMLFAMRPLIPFLLPSLLAAQSYPQLSPKASVTQAIGTTEVAITYHRPAVRGRQIWGGLVPFDQVWRAGANEATTLRFSDQVRIAGRLVPAGTYALFAIPGGDRWTIILNKRAKQFGAWEYDPKLDLMRFDVKPKPAPFSEWLTFEIYPASLDNAYVDLYWEKVRVSFQVEVDVDSIVLGRMTRAIARAGSKDWKAYCDAAEYCLLRERQMNQALQWAQTSVHIQENATTLSLLARIQRELGHNGEALATLEKALNIGRARKEGRAVMGPLEQMLQEWKQKR